MVEKITDIKDLSNIRVGDIVDIAINVKDFDDKIQSVVGTIKCNRIHNICRDCDKCVFDDTMDCANNEICCSRGRADGKDVYFELL